ncbi:MAG: GFA family protein [Gammaproteobacteria bacterium]|nr:GFA family protein [Gammaproteobacteria bacterium]
MAALYQGSCHCGRIAFQVEGDLAQVIECNCSHCSRKGYLLWFVPRAQLRLNTSPTELATYTFNKHVIQHHFCRHCGCAPFGFGQDPSAQAMAAVNVRCLEGVELTTLKRIPFDGRSL